jgi:hypothetical protein
MELIILVLRKKILIINISNLLTMSVPDEGLLKKRAVRTNHSEWLIVA